MAKRAFKVRYAIICDDVRREENGKLFLIGVYAHNIQVTQLPARLLLSLVLAIETFTPVTATIEVRVRANNRVLVRGVASVETSAPGVAFVIAKPIPLPELTREGALVFQVRQDPGRWETVCSLALETRRD